MEWSTIDKCVLHFLLKELISLFLQHNFKVKEDFITVRLFFWPLVTYLWTRVIIGLVETSWGQQSLPKSGKVRFTSSAWTKTQAALVLPYNGWTVDAQRLFPDKRVGVCSIAYVPFHLIGKELKSNQAILLVDLSILLACCSCLMLALTCLAWLWVAFYPGHLTILWNWLTQTWISDKPN